MFVPFARGDGFAALARTISMLWEPLLMLVLLCGSAFFSGSETAFFNLSRRQLRTLRQSKHRLDKLTAALVSNPSDLLASLLFGNMAVNVLFFAVASVLVFRLERTLGAASAAVAAFVSFAVLVLFGEIFPKSLAYGNSKRLSVAAAVPAFVCLKLLKPAAAVLRLLIAEPVLRLLLGSRKAVRPIDTAEFQSLIELVHKGGLITADEDKLLNETVELGLLKVRHVMRPRVDMIACSVTGPAQKACELMRDNDLTKLPVYASNMDNIVGMVELRDLLLHPELSLGKAAQKVDFVPEQKKVDSMLESFRTSGTDTAIVVDEYGGLAGWITLEDIAAELFGPIASAEGIKPVEQLGPFEYRLSGDLAIHEWARSFGIVAAQSRFTTIGGLVTALLGKIPQAGDVAYLRNLKFDVERVRRHRIETIILTLEPVKNDD